MFFLFLIVAISCKRSPEKISSFPLEFNLKGFKIGGKAEFKIVNLNIYDNILIATTISKQNILHLYDLNSLNHISSSIKVGSGPDEIHNPSFSVFNNQKGILWLNDLGEQSVIGYKINNLIKQKKNSFAYIKPPSSTFPDNYFIPVKKSLFLYPTRNPEYYFYCANKKGVIIDSLNIKNKTNIYPSVNKKDLYYALWYHSTIHPSQEKIALAYMFADIIVGIDLKGNIIFQKQGPDLIKEEPQKIRSPNVKETYQKLKSDKDYIYGLYLGKSINSLKGKKYKSNHPNTIFVFNWEGDPIAEIKLEHPILDFAIDKKNKRIITYASNLGEFVYYNLPEKLYND